jgi:hypothetical protein
MITLNTIYALPCETLNLAHVGLREDWFPELESTGSDLYAIQDQLVTDGRLGRLMVKQVLYHYIDGERDASMNSLWFDGQPVALVQNAGRGGRDHQAQWVSNEIGYRALMQYLRDLMAQANPLQITDPDEPHFEETFLSFYGFHFAETLGFTPEPCRSDVMLMPSHNVLPGLPENSAVVLLRVAAPDLPMYIRRGGAVFRHERLLQTDELTLRNPRIVEIHKELGFDRIHLFLACDRPKDTPVQSV